MSKNIYFSINTYVEFIDEVSDVKKSTFNSNSERNKVYMYATKGVNKKDGLYVVTNAKICDFTAYKYTECSIR